MGSPRDLSKNEFGHRCGSNNFESEVGALSKGAYGDRTHIKRADHHTVTPLCGTLLWRVPWRANVRVAVSRRLWNPLYVLDPSIVLDISAGGRFSGSNVQLWAANGSDAQTFAFIPTKPSVSAEGHADVAPGYCFVSSEVSRECTHNSLTMRANQ